MRIQNAIFDLDGTLIDSMVIWRTLNADTIEECTGLHLTPDERQMCLQYPYFDAITRVRPEVAAKCDKDFIYKRNMERMAENYLNGSIDLKPYAREYLLYLKEHDCGVALSTATPKHMCVPYLKIKGIYDLFDCIFAEDDVGQEKSNSPAIYDASLAFLGGTKESTAVFEDAVFCIRTCKQNGYYTVAVENEATQKATLSEIKALADRFIHSYKEMMS